MIGPSCSELPDQIQVRAAQLCKGAGLGLVPACQFERSPHDVEEVRLSETIGLAPAESEGAGPAHRASAKLKKLKQRR